MIIEELKYTHFNAKFKTPFKTSKDTFYLREGFIITLRCSNNLIGFGECSPLPGFSYESIYECEEQLIKLASSLNNFNIGNDIPSFENFINKKNLFPSVKFGIEQCLLNLLIAGDSSFLSKKFGINKKEIPVNAVLAIGNKLDIISDIEKKINQGFKVFKLKIGDDNFNNDFNLIESIRKYFGEDLTIRLDVNGAWTKQESIDRIKYLAPFNIQYIEEPCGHLNSLIEIAKKSPAPIAVDESISGSADALEIIKSTNIQYIVLKPMIISGIFSAIRLIEEAGKKKKKIIISSSFESAVGKGALVFLAALTNHNFAHGLDTADFFEHDICKDSFEVEKGKIFIDSSAYPVKFNLTNL